MPRVVNKSKRKRKKKKDNRKANPNSKVLKKLRKMTKRRS